MSYLNESTCFVYQFIHSKLSFFTANVNRIRALCTPPVASQYAGDILHPADVTELIDSCQPGE